MAYSAPTAHCAVSSETLMLQVRSAHPPMPHQTSSSSCSGVPVGLFGKPKRSTFRFASLTLRCRTEPALRAAPVFRSAYSASRNARPPGSLRSPSDAAPNQLFKLLRCFAWLIHDFAPSPMRALVFRSAYSASRNARASAAFAASIKAHCAVSSETLMLQVRFARPPNPSRPAAAPINRTRQNRVSPPQGVWGAAAAAPDSRGGKGRVKLSPVSAPNQLFKLLRCSGRLIFRKSHLAFSTKRSTSRFAVLTLRTALARRPLQSTAPAKTG